MKTRANTLPSTLVFKTKVIQYAKSKALANIPAYAAVRLNTLLCNIVIDASIPAAAMRNKLAKPAVPGAASAFEKRFSANNASPAESNTVFCASVVAAA